MPLNIKVFAAPDVKVFDALNTKVFVIFPPSGAQEVPQDPSASSSRRASRPAPSLTITDGKPA